MGFPDFFVLIDFIKPHHALISNFISSKPWLSPAADTTPGASHDFNKCMGADSFLNLLHKRFCTHQTAGAAGPFRAADHAPWRIPPDDAAGSRASRHRGG